MVIKSLLNRLPHIELKYTQIHWEMADVCTCVFVYAYRVRGILFIPFLERLMFSLLCFFHSCDFYLDSFMFFLINAVPVNLNTIIKSKLPKYVDVITKKQPNMHSRREHWSWISMHVYVKTERGTTSHPANTSHTRHFHNCCNEYFSSGIIPVIFVFS